jgi:tetratricopeptide (TPR) repeat protein
MDAKYAFASLAVLIWAASAHAQPREPERFHEHHWEHERRPPPVIVMPAPRYAGPDEHSAVHHRTSPPAKAGREADGSVCDNPDNNPDAAIAACGRIIARGQIKGGYSLAVAYAHRGQAYEDKANHILAIADFSEAILLKPAVSGYFAMRGGAQEKSGMVDAARGDFQLALNLDPKNQDALTGLRRVETRSAASAPGTSGHVANMAPPAASGAPTVAPVSPAPSAAPSVPVSVAAAESASGRSSASPSSPAGAATVVTAAMTPPAVAAAAESVNEASATNAHGPRVALVIGNGQYVNANVLPNPPNDAHAMAGVLREIGFEVQEGENLTRANMETQLREFLHKAQTASIVLLFYAGHGMQVDGKNYLVPVDAKLAEPSDLDFETIEIDKVLDQLGDPGHTNIILLDACRDNPLARSFASHLPASRSAAVATGLAPYSAVGTGTLIAYATAPGQTALDGQGADSPFTTSLLHNIKTPGLEIRQVLTRVRAEVASETGNKQIPWDNSSLMGDVVLVKQAP